VLSTSIAETSLTIPDIKVVVDGGKSRRARFDPSSGMSRLVTERVTKAEATQRAGRAGRVQAGDCYKVWTRGEDGALAAYPPAEIDAGDLTGFALELAVWGSGPDELQFVTPPHAGRLAEARGVLQMLGGLDKLGRITPHGRALSRYPLHPRLAHMIETSGTEAASTAALLAERDPLRGASVDLNLRVQALRDPKRFGGAVNRGALERIKTETKRLVKRAPKTKRSFSLAEHAALAYPDRIGLRRDGEAPRFVLSGGKGAVMPPADAMGGHRLIVATDLDGDPREARIRQAVPLAEAELRDLFGDQIQWQNICLWSRRDARVLTRRQERFGALVLEDHTWSDAPDEDIAIAMLDGIRQLGLKLSKSARLFIARSKLMPNTDFPSVQEDHLLETLEDWLLPHINGVRSTADWKAFDVIQALRARLNWDQTQALDQAVPGKFETPLGRTIPIDYSGGQPQISIRLQELFGVTRHPMIGSEPLQITLLSPAQKPVQITTDLPRFWATSYADVRKDMRGAYPRHPWPEDPTQEDPTLRAKRRKQ
jgi:ATP-dependent helicase HrpB